MSEMGTSHPPPPRGVHACIRALSKRRDWVEHRAGGGYDEAERIALSYAIGLLSSANDLGLLHELELEALRQGLIHPSWVDQSDHTKGE